MSTCTLAQVIAHGESLTGGLMAPNGFIDNLLNVIVTNVILSAKRPRGLGYEVGKKVVGGKVKSSPVLTQAGKTDDRAALATRGQGRMGS
jgi:hypothetical protein